MNDSNLLLEIQKGFDSAVRWAKDRPEVSNQLKSSKFVHSIGEKLFTLQPKDTVNLNVIKVNDQGIKESGEWLLDITITQNIDGFKNKIVWAVESESDVSKKAFHNDFAKLFHINSENYLYLNGLNHKTMKGKDKYIEKRLKEVDEIIKNCDKTFWFAFWASPCQSNESPSIWKELHEEGKFKHLKKVRLFKFEEGSYKEIYK
ncbi:MAG: hypothetical protein WCS87_03465 [Methylococcaceae bacterium]